MEKHSNSSDIDLFADVCDDVVEQILGYLPLKEKIRLESVSKQWQRCIFKQQFILRVREYSDDTLDNLLKPIVVSDSARGYANEDFGYQEIRKEEFECVLKRCKFIRSIHLRCYIDDTDLHMIGNCLDGLNALQCLMYGITKNGLLEFGRNYGHKLETLALYRSHYCTVFIREFLKYCPNIVNFSADRIFNYYCEDKNILPKLEEIRDIKIGLVERDIEYLRMLSEKYGKTIKKFHLEVMEFDRRIIDYLIKFVNLQELFISLKITKDSDNNNNQKNIENFLIKLLESYRQLKHLTIWYDIKEPDIPVYCNCKCIKLCEKLKYLMVNCYHISDDFFNDIGQHIANLRTIIINAYQQLTDRSLISMAKLKKLKNVSLYQPYVTNQFITDIGVCELINSCTQIENIYFGARINISNTTIDKLIAIALQRNRINIEFRCNVSQARDDDEVQFESQIDVNRVIDLPNNLTIIFDT